MKTEYELTFWGGVATRYKRLHTNMASAKQEALRVLAQLPNRGQHPAVIYRDGKRTPVATVF